MKKKILLGVITATVVTLCACGKRKEELPTTTLETTTITQTTTEVITEITTTVEESTEESQTETTETESIEETVTEQKSVEDIATIIAGLISGKVAEDEVIKTVKLEDGKLIISVQLGSIPEILTPVDIAEIRIASITDIILEHNELDEYWNTITVDFESTGKITLEKSDIVEQDNIRYFDIDMSNFN